MKLPLVFLFAWIVLIQRAESQLRPFPKPFDVVKTVAQTATKPLEITVKLLTEQFNNFKTKFRKSYASPEEEKKRLEIFSVNFEKIKQLSEKLPFVTKINQYCDLVTGEFNKLLNGLKFRVRAGHTPAKKYVFQNEPIVDQYDWREKGVVAPVKNQGECASCYAFASAAAVESHIAIKSGKLHDTSPQEVLDCSQVEPYENYGCEGGSLEPAYDYIKDKGLVTEKSYPYTATSGDKCNAKTEEITANIKSYVTIAEGDEKALKEALHHIGPIAVGMDASSENWQFYGGGIYYDSDCKSSIDQLNHAVLLVGYGEEKGLKYWIVKNSYGEDWGEKGFARIARNETNHCGIASYAVYPEL